MKRVKIFGIKWLSLMLSLAVLSACSSNTKGQRRVDPHPDQSKKKVQIALLLDTSNSMDGLIEQAKSQLWTIVNELAKAKCDNTRPTVQIALYEYGNDNLPSSEGYIRQVTPLTSDLDELSKDLFELTTNGGNEFCGQVIQSALKQLDWTYSDSDLQMIFIAGNEPFTQGSVNYTSACSLAKSKNVVVNTIFCGNFDEGIRGSWKRGAELTGGTYSSIEQNKKTVYIKSPYDDKILHLNEALNKTYIPYGAMGSRKIQMQKEQDRNAGGISSQNSVKRAVSKSSHVYKNQSWDLVDAAESEAFEIGDVRAEELPAEMQGMDETEREKYVKDKADERSKINSEIQALNKKRTAYVAEQAKENSSNGMLDNAMISAIKKQAKSRNFSIE